MSQTNPGRSTGASMPSRRRGCGTAWSISASDDSGEKYLTNLAASGSAAGQAVIGVATEDAEELQGVNNRVQLAQAEGALRRRIRDEWMLAGVSMSDPESVFIDADAAIGQDTLLLPNTMLMGRTSKLGRGAKWDRVR